MYTAVSDADLTKAVETYKSDFKLRIMPRSRLSKLLLNRLQTYADSADRFGPGSANRRDLANMVDLEREVFARIDSTGRVSMEAWIKGDNGKIGL